MFFAVFSWPHGRAPARPGGLLSGNEDSFAVFRSLMAFYRRPPFSALRFYALPQFNFVRSLDLGKVFTPLNVRRRSHFRDVFIEDFEHWDSDQRREEDNLSGIEGNTNDRQKPGFMKDNFVIPFYAASHLTGQPESFSAVFERERFLVVLGDPGSGKTTLLRWLAWVTSGGLPETARHLGVRERLLPVYAPAARLLSMRKAAEERGSGKWAFIHQTFQEYLAAKHLAMTDSYEDALKENLYSPRWKEVWRLLAGELGVVRGRTPAAAKFIERILDDSRDIPPDELKISVLLGAECLADTVAEDKITKRIFNELNTLITDNREPPSRKWLHETLRQLAATPLGSSLAEILKHKVLDDTGMERKRVTFALAALGYRDVPPGLLEALNNKKESAKRRAEVCSVIGRLKAEGAAQNLLEIMHDKHESIIVRRQAVTALANLGTREAEAEMLSIIRNRKEDEETRHVALIGLGHVSPKKAISEIIKVMKNRQESSITRTFTCSISALLRFKETVPALLGIAKNQDEHKWVRGQAIVAIKLLEAIEAIPELVEMLRDEQEDEHIRQGVHNALSELKLKDTEAVPEIIELLRQKQEDNHKRRKIILALGDLGAGQAIPDLLEILHSNKEDPKLQEAAGEALVKLGARYVAPQLQRFSRIKKNLFPRMWRHGMPTGDWHKTRVGIYQNFRCCSAPSYSS